MAPIIERIGSGCASNPMRVLIRLTAPNDGQRTNANSASAALNKWLKVKIGPDYTIHSFRHSMRDRLRAVECPSDVIDQIGGWLTHGVGNSYGNGYDYNTLTKWMISLIRT